MPTKSDYLYAMPNGSTITTEQYMSEVENGFITRRHHPTREGVVILNYTDETVYEKHWNDVTIHSRGLIIDETVGKILARPFPKFFNMFEIDVTIPNEEPEITHKHDGSLGISYKLDGKTYWSTRGSFESEQAKIAQEIWDKKYNHVTIPENLTFLVEIIHPRTRVVVDYGGIKDLVLLGAINKITGDELPYSVLSKLAEELGLPVAERYKYTIDQMINKTKNLGYNHEGYVAHWKNAGLRLKFKGEEYLKIHKIMYGISSKKKIEYWMNGEIEDLIKLIPEEFRKDVDSLVEMCNNIHRDIKNHVEKFYSELPKHDRKEFALSVNNIFSEQPMYKQFLFGKYNNRDYEHMIKKFIHKNYINLGLGGL